MKIRDILSQRENKIMSVGPTDTVRKAVEIMNTQRVGSLMVLGPDDEILGIFTERDVLRNIDEKVLDKSVGQLMTDKEHIFVGHTNDSIDYAMNIFVTKKVRHLPIINEVSGKLDGIISIGDVVQSQLSDVEFENRMMMNYITGSYGT